MRLLSRRHATTLFLGLADVLSALVVFNVIAFFRGVIPWDSPLATPLVVPCVLLLFTIYVIDGYSGRTDFISLDYTSVHVIAIVLATLATLLVTFAFVPEGFSINQSRGVIVLGFLTLTPLTIAY